MRGGALIAFDAETAEHVALAADAAELAPPHPARAATAAVASGSGRAELPGAGEPRRCGRALGAGRRRRRAGAHRIDGAAIHARSVPANRSAPELAAAIRWVSARRAELPAAVRAGIEVPIEGIAAAVESADAAGDRARGLDAIRQVAALLARALGGGRAMSRAAVAIRAVTADREPGLSRRHRATAPVPREAVGR